MVRQDFDIIEELNNTYDKLHRTKEELFWSTKMGISKDFEAYNIAEENLNAFRQDAENLKRCRGAIKEAHGKDIETLRGWIAFFEANTIESDDAKTLNTHIVALESKLALARNKMPLGYQNPKTQEFTSCSSVELALKMLSHDDEEVRKACFQGFESIERFVLENGFLDIVRSRNAMARFLGYDDFYAYKLKVTEGISMEELFHWLEALEEGSRESTKKALNALKQEKGEDGILPWNFSYSTQGDITKELDPYMPFSDAVLRWGKSFSAMNIQFNEGVLQLDLLDRKGKYDNGFCHAPVAAYRHRNGKYVTAHVNFASNAIPHQVGSGYNALKTLFHEGGHAVHFANIDMGAPCFSQEFAPSSVAMAETQSMFCDSILSDSDWMYRYGSVPWELIKKKIEKTHPLRSMFLRRMLTVPFFEKELYALDDDALTVDRVMGIAKRVEQKMLFMERSPRPTLSIPHLLDSESSAYYHGYILAECAVEQTRDFFFKRDGHIVDNPKVGPELKEKYWKPGNAIPFVQFIERLVQSPFSVQPFLSAVTKTVEDALKEQKGRLDFIQGIPQFKGAVDLNFTIRLVHGGTVIASSEDGSFEEMAQKFKMWVEGEDYKVCRP